MQIIRHGRIRASVPTKEMDTTGVRKVAEWQIAYPVGKTQDSCHKAEKSLNLTVEALCLRYLFSRPVTRHLSSAYMSLTSVFGMGTGGPS